MIRYRVKKCRHGRCLCTVSGFKAHPWQVVRVNGLEQRTMSRWPGQAAALDAALELAGLSKPVIPLHLLVTKAPHVPSGHCGPAC